MPLTGIIATQSFKKWEIDFMGPISPTAKHTKARYIIVAMDYYTKWVEARATHQADACSIAKFLYK